MFIGVITPAGENISMQTILMKIKWDYFWKIIKQKSQLASLANFVQIAQIHVQSLVVLLLLWPKYFAYFYNFALKICRKLPEKPNIGRRWLSARSKLEVVA